jgi:hypothetical protein
MFVIEERVGKALSTVRRVSVTVLRVWIDDESVNTNIYIH